MKTIHVNGERIPYVIAPVKIPTTGGCYEVDMWGKVLVFFTEEKAYVAFESIKNAINHKSVRAVEYDN